MAAEGTFSSFAPDHRLFQLLRDAGVAESIAQNTKLSVRHLQAIESGDFRKLPGGIYNTNYIRQYARAIGFDEAKLLGFYHSQPAMQL